MTGTDALVPDADAEAVAAALLLAAPGIGPRRAADLVRRHGTPAAALGALRRRSDNSEQLTRWLRSAEADAAAARARRWGARAWHPGHPAWPVRDEPPDGPGLLLVDGDADPRAPRVAIVGTRAASPPGLTDARALGRLLAHAGVVVVSGLAIGIDGAAHEGALEAGGHVIGVVATGLDVVYPRRHARLFDAVRTHGAIITEAAFGTRAEPWRFPVRNRVIAAVADVVVVVEATARGGARITAEHALAYGRPVLAMPGSRRNPAAVGCNALIADGAHPLLAPADVLVALGLAGVATDAPPRPPTDPDERQVWQALHGEAATIDELCARTGLELGRVAGAIRRLEAVGRVARGRGLLWAV